jgi:3-phenylpropionate/cinnamic acid dioxygenase small subunit
MSDEDAIRRTIAQYCQLCDDGRFDEWADLYTDNATFSVMGNTYTGRAEVKAFIEKGQPPESRGKHICFNTVIDVDRDGEYARACTDYIFIDRNRVITSAGRYHDRFVRQPDRWRFSERRIVFMGEES